MLWCRVFGSLKTVAGERMVAVENKRLNLSKQYYADAVRVAALVLATIICVQFLSACGTPTRAPVVSRDGTQQIKNRPPYHRVKKSETLYAIAWRYGLDFRVLAHWNRIARPYTIYPGQTLRLSQPPAAKRSKASKSRHKQSTPTAAKSVKARKPAAAKTRPKIGSASAKQRSSKQKTKSTPTRRTKLGWRWPTRGKVAQRFEAGNPVRKGIKISGRAGQSIIASESGKVVYAGSGLIGYGRLVIIKHNKNYLSAYAHNRKLLVQEGREVARGESIAEMGNNGNWPMLHFEIRHNGTPVDPLKLLPRQR